MSKGNKGVQRRQRRLQARGNAEYRKLKINHLKIYNYENLRLSGERERRR